jgi:hypothetical protein
LSGNGELNLKPPASGPYRGILMALPASNSNAVTLSGNASLSGMRGTIYAPSSQVSLSGNGSLIKASIISSTVRFTGNGGNALLEGGSQGNVTVDVPVLAQGQLRSGDTWVSIYDPEGYFTAARMERLYDAVDTLSESFAAYGIRLLVVSGADAELADLVITVAATSLIGGADEGVLGYSNADGMITLISGWDWYDGVDASAIGAEQYDFQTIVTHELGHGIGLQHSPATDSVMHAVLVPGTSRRELVASDLQYLGDDEHDEDGGEGLRAASRRASLARLPQQSLAMMPLAIDHLYAAFADRPRHQVVPSVSGIRRPMNARDELIDRAHRGWLSLEPTAGGSRTSRGTAQVASASHGDATLDSVASVEEHDRFFSEMGEGDEVLTDELLQTLQHDRRR